MSDDHPVISEWLQELNRHRGVNINDNPNYYVSDPSTLLTTCTPLSFKLGTGEQLLSQALIAASNATHEVLLVTCFWANSPSQALIAQLLRNLSAKALSSASTTSPNNKIRVRICISSLSLPQKLFHTTSPTGKNWPESTWASKFGLPHPGELTGLDLEVKSCFFRPFSVVHPKFLIVDREVAWVLSCNVSWEEWFEGGVCVRGGIVDGLLRFYDGFWGRLPVLNGLVKDAAAAETRALLNGNGGERGYEETELGSIFHKTLQLGTIPALLLPSPHHQNPQFRLYPFCDSAPPPPTPLNTFLLTLWRNARRTIYIQTPNITCSAVISALLSALNVGVDVHIVTSSKLMVLEQLGTAGTITEWSIKSMQKRYEKLKSERIAQSRGLGNGDDEEALRNQVRVGELTVQWYTPNAENVGVDGRTINQEPVKSHFKCCVVDEEVTVLGSGNLDRASWFTSQELGVAFFSREFAGVVREGARDGLVGRTT